MSIKKSRKYDIDGTNYAFDFDGGKLVGIKEDINGVLTPVNPNTSAFSDIANSDEALRAYNVAKYTSAKKSYEDTTERLTASELNDYYTKENQKLTNEQFVDIETSNSPPLAFTTPKTAYGAYRRGKTAGSDVMAYPLDIDLNQDHMKITRHEYRRPTVNQSKSQRDVNYDSFAGRSTYNVAGDSVVGSEIGGSIFLPMPKATDVNGVEWGKSELTISGLAAVGAAQKTLGAGSMITNLNLTGKEAKDSMADFMANLGRGPQGNEALGAKGFAQAQVTQLAAKAAGAAFGTEVDMDTFLARAGGRVLNPNAEMLFQGPVIRDFAFEFTMIARSQKEGEEIRKIIRFLKVGMAPKFNSTTFLANPDVFTLQYKNGKRDGDMLKTVNQFNPGGLALTTMNVDYAPNGYWSAYRDSQPVAVKMGLNFTELRPIYEGDQEQGTPKDSVGY